MIVGTEVQTWLTARSAESNSRIGLCAVEEKNTKLCFSDESTCSTSSVSSTLSLSTTPEIPSHLIKRRIFNRYWQKVGIRVAECQSPINGSSVLSLSSVHDNSLLTPQQCSSSCENSSRSREQHQVNNSRLNPMLSPTRRRIFTSSHQSASCLVDLLAPMSLHPTMRHTLSDSVIMERSCLNRKRAMTPGASCLRTSRFARSGNTTPNKSITATKVKSSSNASFSSEQPELTRSASNCSLSSTVSFNNEVTVLYFEIPKEVHSYEGWSNYFS